MGLQNKKEYWKLRNIFYENYKQEEEFKFRDFLKAQSYFTSKEKKSVIAYTLLLDQLEFVDRTLVSHLNEVKDSSSNFCCMDVGCGLGTNLKMLKDKGIFSSSSFYALEYDSGKDDFFNLVRSFLREEFGLAKGRVIEADVTDSNRMADLNLELSSAYAVGLLSRLEHPRTAISNLKGLLKQGGTLFFDFYDPKGYTNLPFLGRISNLDLGRIWYSMDKTTLATTEGSKERIVKFVPENFKFSLLLREPLFFLNKRIPFDFFDELLTDLFWNPGFFWHSPSYIRKLLKEEGFEISGYEESENTPKAFFVAEISL